MTTIRTLSALALDGTSPTSYRTTYQKLYDGLGTAAGDASWVHVCPEHEACLAKDPNREAAVPVTVSVAVFGP